MSDRDWETFFALMEKIINMNGMSAGEKAEEVRRRAKAEGAETALGEFANYNLGDDD